MSELVWKIAPAASSSARSASVLVRLPLWAQARGAAAVLHREGLRVADVRPARGGVAHVPDGDGAGERGDRRGGEDLLHQPHRPVDVEAAVVDGGDAGGLLAPVLERVEPEVGEVGGLGVAVHRHHAALVVEVVVVEFVFVAHGRRHLYPTAAPWSSFAPMGRVICAALATLLAASPCGAFHLEDSLRGSTRGNLVGGVIMADGWHVTDRRDRVWYALPRLTSGSVEFTVTNLTMASLGDTADSEIFAMYEAGYGIAEPISYGDFRENHYKCMLRLYGNGETARGSAEAHVGDVSLGGAGYDACGCASFSSEPFGNSGPWDGSAQRLRIEWGDGTTRYLRNGRVVVTIDWSQLGADLRPLVAARVAGHVASERRRQRAAPRRHGVLRPGDGRHGGRPRDLSGRGSPATPDRLPTRTAPVMSGDTLSRSPAVEDVTVAPSSPTTVYPDVNDLSVGAGDSEFYVKSRVPAVRGRVVRAQLLLQSSTDRTAMGTGASVFRAGSASWSETSLTWSARPGTAGGRLGRIDGVKVDAPTGLRRAAGRWRGE